MAVAVIARRRGWRSLFSISNQAREMSDLVQQNVNWRRAFLLDTLSLTKRLEQQGVESKHTEAIALVIKEVINDSLENVSQSFVSNEKMRMWEMIQEANFLMLKYEVQTLQGLNLSSLQSEVEKLKVKNEKRRNLYSIDIEDMQSEHIMDNEIMQSEHKVDNESMRNELKGEIHALKVRLEESKFEVIKYYIGTVVSLSVVGLSIIKIFL